MFQLAVCKRSHLFELRIIEITFFFKQQLEAHNLVK